MGRHRVDPRIDVRYPIVSGARQRELRAFTAFCISRMERELAGIDSWVMNIRPGRIGFEALVRVSLHGHVIEQLGAGRDATLAVWDSLCNVEQLLREELRAA
jgi:hypothetical protein